MLTLPGILGRTSGSRFVFGGDFHVIRKMPAIDKCSIVRIQNEGRWFAIDHGTRFAVASPSVLVVGSGTGNDVAAALRHNSSSVDAVEIDPAILELGKREHPEHPYASPRVSVHLTDARAFLKRTTRKYDVVLFGLLDSHTQFSDYSNMRIDNFVYTEESFREAKNHLNPNGIIFVKFQVNHPWMGGRLRKMLTNGRSSPVS